MAQGRADFRVPGVIIWSRPSAQSTRNGLGYPGQGFDWDDAGSLFGSYRTPV